VRPKFEAALDACRQIKAHAPHCRVILTVYEMKRLGRDSVTALADHLTAHGIALEILAGPLTGIYDPSGTGRVLFAFFAAMAENIREATLEGMNAAARKGHHSGRPPVITDDMLHTVLRRRVNGETAEAIRPDLIIPTGDPSMRQGADRGACPWGVVWTASDPTGGPDRAAIYLAGVAVIMYAPQLTSRPVVYWDSGSVIPR
jgi:hypothetical protein